MTKKTTLTERVTIRLSVDEKKRLINLAARAKMTISTYLRYIYLRDTIEKW